MSYTEIEYAMLKTDLGFLHDPPQAVAEYMEKLLETAEARLERDGITLDHSDFADAQLVVMYAAWLYRKRDSGGGKPRMLREALNDRKIHGKVAAT